MNVALDPLRPMAVDPLTPFVWITGPHLRAVRGEPVDELLAAQRRTRQSRHLGLAAQGQQHITAQNGQEGAHGAVNLT